MVVYRIEVLLKTLEFLLHDPMASGLVTNLPRARRGGLCCAVSQ